MLQSGQQYAQDVFSFVVNKSKLGAYVREKPSVFAGVRTICAVHACNPIYRNDSDRFPMLCRIGGIILAGVLLVIVVVLLGTALDGILKPRPASSYPTGIWPNVPAGAWIGRIVFGTLHALLMIAFMLVLFVSFYGGLYVVLPTCFLFLLFLLPGVIYDSR